MSSIPVLTPDILHSHEEAFCKYYQWLIRWGLQFSGNDRERAEELVQEVFAQLIFSHTDLSAVQNIPAYLYATLHNTHVSQVRMAARSHTQSLSIVDYNLADTALRASDPSVLYQTQDHLRRVCQYACARKQSSRAGSVLILRFFHCYHVSEVAKVVGCTADAIRQCLRYARNEARLFLENPAALSFIDQAQLTKLTSYGSARNAEELLFDLRRAVFRSCQGECIPGETLRSFYQINGSSRPDNSVIAHLVSCRRCLDTVNYMLGIPLLVDRFGDDSSGADDNSGSNAAGGGKRSNQRGKQAKAEPTSRSLVLRFRRRARELFEYYPRELRVSVNGHILGSHSVNSELSRMRLDITLPEPISFLEVMTEESTRLLMMSIDPPPTGDPRQMRRVVLSDNRSLEATLQYGHPWPMLEVVYHNPNYETDSQVRVPEFDEPPGFSVIEGDSVKSDLPDNQPITLGCDTPTSRSQSIKKKTARWIASWSEIFKSGFPHLSSPGVVTAILSVILIGALLFFWLNVTPTPSNNTADILYQARIAENAASPRADEVIHRVLTLEELNYPSRTLIAKSRIELWKDVNGKSSRRVYDEKSQLVAGEWVKGKEPQRNHSQQAMPSRMIYQKGQRPRFESSTSNPHQAVSNLEAWRLEPSVSDFQELIGKPESFQVKESLDTYVITYSASQEDDNIVLAATLKLRKSDLHAEEGSLVLRRNGEAREYRLVEAAFERRPISAVAPKVFEPDAELLGAGGGAGRHEKGPIHPSVPLPVASFSPVASSELEVEVAFLLDPFRVRFGDQISLTRTGEGALLVQAIVDTEEAKAELLHTLSPVARNPAVNISVSTAVEALQRQQRDRPNQPIVRQFTGSADSIPAYKELHQYFSRNAASRQRDSDPHSSTDDTDRAIRTFTAQVVSRSRRVLSHAIELKQLKERFKAGTLNALSPDARKKLLGMIRNHAEAVRGETRSLLEQLQPIFFVSKHPEKPAAIDVSSDEELALAVERLHKLVIANDAAIRSAFSASSERPETTPLRDPRFRTALGTVGDLAERIQLAASAQQ